MYEERKRFGSKKISGESGPFLRFVQWIAVWRETGAEGRQPGELPGESIVSFADKDGRKVTVKRYRDAVRKACGNALYAIFAVEGQDKAHYAMPVREMLYDAMSYTSQVEQAALRHRENGDYQNSAQFFIRLFP